MNQIAIRSMLIWVNIMGVVEPHLFTAIPSINIVEYYGIIGIFGVIFLVVTGRYDKSEIAQSCHIPLRRCFVWTYNLIFFSGGTFVFIGSMYYFDDIHHVFLATAGGYIMALFLAICESCLVTKKI